MPSVTWPLRALFLPADGVPKAVSERRWVLPLLLACALSAAAGVSVGSRLDTSRTVVPMMAMTGELQKASEREISDKVEQASRVAIVAGAAKGIFLVPLETLLLAVALKLLAWLLGKKAKFVDLFAAAAVALLPIALHALITAVVALRLDVVTPKMLLDLVPSSARVFAGQVGPGVDRILRAIDFFNLWAAGLLGLGFASASQMKPWKGVLLGLFLYVLFAGVFLVGLPGMAPAGGGMGGPR